VVDRNKAMELTLAWARQARIVPGVAREAIASAPRT
jgi:hypothetical protein